MPKCNSNVTVKRTLLLHFGTRELFSPDEESCYVFSTQNNSCEFLVSNGRTLLLHFGTRDYLFSPDKGSCYIFSTQSNCCEFLAQGGQHFNISKFPDLSRKFSLNWEFACNS